MNLQEPSRAATRRPATVTVAGHHLSPHAGRDRGAVPFPDAVNARVATHRLLRRRGDCLGASAGLHTGAAALPALLNDDLIDGHLTARLQVTRGNRPRLALRRRLHVAFRTRRLVARGTRAVRIRIGLDEQRLQPGKDQLLASRPIATLTELLEDCLVARVLLGREANGQGDRNLVEIDVWRDDVVAVAARFLDAIGQPQLPPAASSPGATAGLHHTHAALQLAATLPPRKIHPRRLRLRRGDLRHLPRLGPRYIAGGYRVLQFGQPLQRFAETDVLRGTRP